jgi:hypothetical protein
VFATVSIIWDAFADLSGAEFKLMAAICRYTNRVGECSPSLRQLSLDTRSSKTATSRGMAALEERGCITRSRPRNGERYVYTIAQRFLPVWPSQIITEETVPMSEPPTVPISEPSPKTVPISERTVPQRGTQQVSLLSKKLKDARARELRTARNEEENQRRARDWVKTGFWLRDGTWGPRPDQPGCTLPPNLLAWCLAERAKRSALVARVASAHSGRQEESLHARREGVAGTGTGLPTKEQMYVLRPGQ